MQPGDCSASSNGSQALIYDALRAAMIPSAPPLSIQTEEKFAFEPLLDTYRTNTQLLRENMALKSLVRDNANPILRNLITKIEDTIKNNREFQNYLYQQLGYFEGADHKKIISFMQQLVFQGVLKEQTPAILTGEEPLSGVLDAPDAKLRPKDHDLLKKLILDCNIVLSVSPESQNLLFESAEVRKLKGSSPVFYYLGKTVYVSANIIFFILQNSLRTVRILRIASLSPIDILQSA